MAWEAQAPVCAVTSQDSISLPVGLVDGRLWSGEIALVSSEVSSARSCMQQSLSLCLCWIRKSASYKEKQEVYTK